MTLSAMHVFSNQVYLSGIILDKNCLFYWITIRSPYLPCNESFILSGLVVDEAGFSLSNPIEMILRLLSNPLCQSQVSNPMLSNPICQYLELIHRKL